MLCEWGRFLATMVSVGLVLTCCFLFLSIFFFDSLEKHNTETYANHVRRWLNHEWKRLGKGRIRGREAVFQKLALCAPKSELRAVYGSYLFLFDSLI